MERIAEINRETKETKIYIKLNIDGKGETKLDYPLGFMRHMLNTFARHGLFDIEARAEGDIEVDQHHLVEDTGIALGQCFEKALGEKRGIRRNGSCLFPMDECLARAAVDICGRSFLYFDGQLSLSPVISASGNGSQYKFETSVIEDFWQAFTCAAGCNLHLEIIRGRSDHHKIEAMFKAASRALRAACEYDDRAKDAVPSTKGALPHFKSMGVIV
ncbi:MAG: imidazoleglycerol-phosphate dehydratase HisB [Treponema sp.]|nr:imidazoleglycerol-phosphate dehydratase HisB [Treponema sp.]